LSCYITAGAARRLSIERKTRRTCLRSQATQCVISRSPRGTRPVRSTPQCAPRACAPSAATCRGTSLLGHATIGRRSSLAAVDGDEVVAAKVAQDSSHIRGREPGTRPNLVDRPLSVNRVPDGEG